MFGLHYQIIAWKIQLVFNLYLHVPIKKSATQIVFDLTFILWEEAAYNSLRGEIISPQRCVRACACACACVLVSSPSYLPLSGETGRLVGGVGPSQNRN